MAKTVEEINEDVTNLYKNVAKIAADTAVFMKATNNDFQRLEKQVDSLLQTVHLQQELINRLLNKVQL